MRVFKRPMFRRGGSTDQGIMTGLVDRRRYDKGAFGKAAKEYATDIAGLMGKPDINQLLISGGMNLVSGQGATGRGTLADVASAYKGPTDQYFQRVMANKQIANKLGVELAMKEKLAQQKQMSGTGLQKDYSPQRAYETAVSERIKSANELKPFEDPSVEQKYPRATAHYDVYILRNLRATENEKGQEIYANQRGFVPYDKKLGEFNYGAMQPGAYYFDPRIRAFVQRVPDTTNDQGDIVKGGYFRYDPNTFKKTKISGLEKS